MIGTIYNELDYQFSTHWFRETRFFKYHTIHGHGSHLGHMTSITLINFHFLVPKKYIQNLVENGPVVSEKKQFLDLNLSIYNDIVSTKIYDKRDNFNFDIVKFLFLDGVVPRRPTYGIFIQLRSLIIMALQFCEIN